VLIDFLNRLLEREKINKNFESLEIAIIAEFHLFNLIFAKEEF